MLHFAYGSNMHRAVMRRHAREAQPLGVAELADYRFVITADGYASVVAMRGRAVCGVLWRLSPRDRVTLDAWENVARRHYRGEIIAVRSGGRRRPALVYIARPRPTGIAKAGYMELVIAAAHAWSLPPTYIASLQDWLPGRGRGAATPHFGAFGWT